MAVLPDLLKPGLKVVFCGSAVGPTSARVGAYYARRGNRFWEVLHRVGLTPRQLVPEQFRDLASYDIGLTDIAKESWGVDKEISYSDADVKRFHAKILKYRPKVIAFNGKRAAQALLRRKTGYGRADEKIGETTIFVLPSTSGAARASWDEFYWLELAGFVGSTPPPNPGTGPPKVHKRKATQSGTSLVEKGRQVDAAIREWLRRTGQDPAKPKDVMATLIEHGIFSSDHREGFPLRKLLNRLHDAGQLSVVSTAQFEQKPKNKSWYFTLRGDG